MGKFTEDAKELLEAVGGASNIGAVSHCVTRMRFVLNDPSIADIPRIERIPSAKGTFTQAGQFQVIIGNEVADFYNDFAEVSGVSGVSKAEVKAASKQNQNVIQRIMTSIAEIFAPIIPALIVGGLILGFRNVIDSMEVFNGATLVSQSQFWAGVDSFLWLIGEAIFHLGIPVGICWSVMKKMGGTEILGIIMGLTLVSSQLLNAYAVAGTAAADIPKWDFGFTQVNMIGYQAQVIPAILAAFTLAYLERFFKKISPKVVSMIVVPFCSLLLAVMAAHFVLGPIGWKIGSVVSDVVYAGISGQFRVIFGAVFGFFYAPLVITGLHHMSNAIDLQLISDFGGTMLWPMIALSNIAQGSAVLGMIALQRKDEKAQELNIPSAISCYLGVTEPAMFGVNLRYKFPFICGMIGSSIAAIIATATSTTASAIGVGGIPGILSIQPASMAFFAIEMLIAIVVPFVLTYIYGKRQGIGQPASADADIATVAAGMGQSSVSAVAAEAIREHKPVDLVAFMDGKTVDIADVPDQVFASKALGNGMAIEPTGNTLYAPADATVTVTMDDSNHAVGLTLNNNVEILLHIGLDTVDMKGDGFTCHVKMGDSVKKGQKLITFDPAKIKAAGHETVTMMVLTDEAGFENISYKLGETVKAGQDVITEVK